MQANKSNPTRSNEPRVWLLFGAGGSISAIFYPIIAVVVAFLLPLGIISAENIVVFSQTLIGKLVIFLLLAIPALCFLHRIHHGLHDLKVHLPARTSGIIFYGLAILFSLITILALTRIF